MQNRVFGVLALCVIVGGSLAASAHEPTEHVTPIVTDIDSPARPWTSLAPRNEPGRFQFAIVADRTGGHRPGVFPLAMEKLNLLQPEFVVSVGDVIEGYSRDVVTIEREWDEFDGFVKSLDMPFFYVPGNHDYTNEVMAEVWRKRLGPSYYGFVYRDVLFLCLNSMAGGEEVFGAEQVAWVGETLAKHKDVRWTFVLVHHPLWAYEHDSGWSEVSDALQGRGYTVFAGHWHNYQHYVRNDRTHIVLSTTGGASELRGPVYGEFDHVMWVTMTEDGPRLANLMLDGIHDEHIRSESDAAIMVSFASAGAVQAEPIYVTTPTVSGELRTRLRLTNDADTPLEFNAAFEATVDGGSTPPPVAATIGPNSVAFVELALPIGTPLPVGQVLPYFLEWSARLPASENTFTGTLYFGADKRWPITRSTQSITVDGDLSDWDALPYDALIVDLEPARKNWAGPEDGALKFGLAYDDAYVYLAAEVVDNEVVTDPAAVPWEQDGVMVFFDARPDPQRSAGRGQGAMTEYLLIASTPGESGPETVFMPEILPRALKVTNLRTPRGYNVEIAIPISYLNRQQGGDWQAFRLGVRMSDYDAGEKTGDESSLSWRPWWQSEYTFPGSGTFVKE